MPFSYKYGFVSPNMRATTRFELLTAQNLSRLGVTSAEIERIETFEYLPGTLYPEMGNFCDTHPAAGSFGVHLFLTGGRSAWLYGRLSYDYNPAADHYDGDRHWNYEIAGVRPNGQSIDPYRRLPHHCLPDSDFIQVGITHEELPFQTYTITRV